MNEAKEEVEEYEVYFTTPSGKFLEAIMTQNTWNYTLIDTEPTSFFTLVVKRTTGEIDIWKEKRDIGLVGQSLGLTAVFSINNGEPLRVSKRPSCPNVSGQYNFILIYQEYDNQEDNWLGFEEFNEVNVHYDIILNVEFANQPRHVIK